MVPEMIRVSCASCGTQYEQQSKHGYLSMFSFPRCGVCGCTEERLVRVVLVAAKGAL
jgi:NAD-dependent SIR2 family protein deacetylase